MFLDAVQTEYARRKPLAFHPARKSSENATFTLLLSL